MISDVLHRTLQLLKDLDISAIVIGELALNYYNVPCVLHEIEICIRGSQLAVSEHALSSSPQFERLPQPEFDLFTAYKKGCPRFLDLEWRQTPIVLLSEVETRFHRLKTVCKSAHNGQVFYSNEILSCLSVKNITQTPIPTLPSLIQYYCRLYFDSRDDMHRIRLEQLVDGMNVDHQWCERNLFNRAHSELILELTDSKRSRIDDFTGNLVTCTIRDQETAKCVARIPGYESTDS